MPTIQELNPELNKAIAEAKKAIEEAKKTVLKFKEHRKEFDKTIENYNKFRNEKFDKEQKETYDGLKKDIKNLEKEIMDRKAKKENIDNLYFLDQTGVEQLRRFFADPQIANIPKHMRTDNGRNYGFKDLLCNVDGNVEEAKKRLSPLFETAKTYKFKWETITERRNEITNDIKQKNNKILELRQHKDYLKKEVNPYPSASFGYKIAHSEKVDPDKYSEKFKECDSRLDKVKNDKQLEHIDNNIKKIKARFKRVTRFMYNYSEQLNSIIETKFVTDEQRADIANRLKQIEQEEMAVSLKDKQNLAEQLGIGNFTESIGPQTVINISDDGTGQIKTSNMTTPNLAFTVGRYWLQTPFGRVRVEVDSDSNLMIYPESRRVAPTYDVISLKLDSIFEDKKGKKGKKGKEGKEGKEVIREVINPIINYLKQTAPFSIKGLRNQNLLNKIIVPTKISETFLTDKQKEAAATLCGILMLSESHQFRNPTLGKFERSSVKRVKQLAQKGFKNPFSMVYANKSGEYINAHDRTSDSDSDIPNRSDGGHKQTRQLLRCNLIGNDIAVRVQDLPNFITGAKSTGIEDTSSKINNNKRIDANGTTNPTGDYIKIKDLDSLTKTKYEFFTGDRGQTIREFVEKQINRNMRSQYKMLNRTPKKTPETTPETTPKTASKAASKTAPKK